MIKCFGELNGLEQQEYLDAIMKGDKINYVINLEKDALHQPIRNPCFLVINEETKNILKELKMKWRLPSLDSVIKKLIVLRCEKEDD